MKNDIVLAGVGGQGILTIAAIVAQAAVSRGLNVKQSEVHGMAQRGGSVSAHLRLSSAAIQSDLIPAGGADVVLGMELMEALRQAPCLGPQGVLIANAVSICNIEQYPEEEALLAELRRAPRHLIIDAESLAKQAGSARAANMVLLGALANCLDLDQELLSDSMAKFFASKGEQVQQTNLAAFRAGAACRASA